eukprot:GILJ01011577.1.p1 GENE.GILJ01011577.1~~GILJ01011577.1.p1  ORF type:complete len:950 (+),score=99.38 GILJ01011577.1:2-2851(+)
MREAFERLHRPRIASAQNFRSFVSALSRYGLRSSFKVLLWHSHHRSLFSVRYQYSVTRLFTVVANAYRNVKASAFDSLLSTIPLEVVHKRNSAIRRMRRAVRLSLYRSLLRWRVYHQSGARMVSGANKVARKQSGLLSLLLLFQSMDFRMLSSAKSTVDHWRLLAHMQDKHNVLRGTRLDALLENLRSKLLRAYFRRMSSRLPSKTRVVFASLFEKLSTSRLRSRFTQLRRVCESTHRTRSLQLKAVSKLSTIVRVSRTSVVRTFFSRWSHMKSNAVDRRLTAARELRRICCNRLSNWWVQWRLVDRSIADQHRVQPQRIRRSLALVFSKLVDKAEARDEHMRLTLSRWRLTYLEYDRAELLRSIHLRAVYHHQMVRCLRAAFNRFAAVKQMDKHSVVSKTVTRLVTHSDRILRSSLTQWRTVCQEIHYFDGVREVMKSTKLHNLAKRLGRNGLTRAYSQWKARAEEPRLLGRMVYRFGIVAMKNAWRKLLMVPQHVTLANLHMKQATERLTTASFSAFLRIERYAFTFVRSFDRRNLKRQTALRTMRRNINAQLDKAMLKWRLWTRGHPSYNNAVLTKPSTQVHEQIVNRVLSRLYRINCSWEEHVRHRLQQWRKITSDRLKRSTVRSRTFNRLIRDRYRMGLKDALTRLSQFRGLSTRRLAVKRLMSYVNQRWNRHVFGYLLRWKSIATLKISSSVHSSTTVISSQSINYNAHFLVQSSLSKRCNSSVARCFKRWQSKLRLGRLFHRLCLKKEHRITEHAFGSLKMHMFESGEHRLLRVAVTSWKQFLYDRSRAKQVLRLVQRGWINKMTSKLFALWAIGTAASSRNERMRSVFQDQQTQLRRLYQQQTENLTRDFHEQSEHLKGQLEAVSERFEGSEQENGQLRDKLARAAELLAELVEKVDNMRVSSLVKTVATVHKRMLINSFDAFHYAALNRSRKSVDGAGLP